MPDLSDRRTWLAVLAATGLSTALPDSTNAAQDTKNDASNVLKRLNKVADVLQTAGERLVTIQEGFAIPPDDQRPPLRAALITIQAQAAGIYAIADDLLLQLEAR